MSKHSRQSSGMVGLGDVLQAITWWLAHFLVLGGLALGFEQFLIDMHVIGISVINGFYEKIAAPFLAALSLLLVSASIYFESSERTPPTAMSKWFSAPVMMTIAVILFVKFLVNWELASRYVDSMSLMALGGAMLRLTGIPRAIWNAKIGVK